MTNAKVYLGFHDNKKLKSTDMAALVQMFAAGTRNTKYIFIIRFTYLLNGS